jgi:hypothetical protein
VAIFGLTSAMTLSPQSSQSLSPEKQFALPEQWQAKAQQLLLSARD